MYASKSSVQVYWGKWSIFCDWCLGRDISPVKTCLVASLLLYPFEQGSLTPIAKGVLLGP